MSHQRPQLLPGLPGLAGGGWGAGEGPWGGGGAQERLAEVAHGAGGGSAFWLWLLSKGLRRAALRGGWDRRKRV